MTKLYNSIPDIDECVSKIFSNHEVATVEKVCAMSSYTEKELQNLVEAFYEKRRKPHCFDLLSYYIEDCWFWKLIYAYKFFKNKDSEERIINFLNKYNLTIDFIDALVRRHPIQSPEFYFFRAALVEYYNKMERQEKKSQNEKLATALNLDVLYEIDDLSNKVNCLKITNRFICQETLLSLGIRCLEVEIVKGPCQERLTKDLNNVDPEMLKNIDDNGIIKIGTFVHGGDIVVAKEKPSEHGGRYYNTSVVLAQTLEGVVIDVKVKSKANGDLLKGRTDILIQVYIEIQLPVKIGDVFIDKSGKKGVVVGKIDRDDVDLIANFDFDGSVVRRLDSPRDPQVLHVRGGADRQYSEFNGSPVGSGISAPVVLTKTLMKKFIQSEYFSVLQDIMFIPSGNVRRKVRTVEYQTSRLCNICNKNAIVGFVEMGRAIGFDMRIYAFGSNEIEYEKIINDPDLKVEIIPMTNERIDEISNGEVIRSESFDHRTLERVNGGLWDMRIFGQCEAEMRQFMGHINLPITYSNPLFPQLKLNKILVYPVRYRWIKIDRSGSIVTNWSQEAYARIMHCKNRLERSVELGLQQAIIKKEKQMLGESIEEYYTRGTERYPGVFADYFMRIRDYFIGTKIDYCANMRASVSSEVTNGMCWMPWAVIDKMFQNRIITMLSSEMDGNYITIEDKLRKNLYGDKIFDEVDEETIKRRKLGQSEKYYEDNRENGLLMEKVNRYLLDEHVFCYGER